MGIIDDWFLNVNLEMVVITDHLDDIFHGQTLLLAVVSGMVAIKARSLRSGSGPLLLVPAGAAEGGRLGGESQQAGGGKGWCCDAFSAPLL